MRTDFVVLCFPTTLSTVITGSVPMHFSEISSRSCMRSLKTFLEQASWLEIASSIQNFLARFSARMIEDYRRFLAGSGAKLKI